MQPSVAQIEAELARLEGDKGLAERELADTTAKKKGFSVQIVAAAFLSLIVLGIPWFLYLIAIKLPTLNKALKAAQTKLRDIEDAISAKRVALADLRARAAGT
jgi:hypothetical protein